MAKVIGYTRSAVDEQGKSQAIQERSIREWCEREGHELIRIYNEAPMSGLTGVDERPALKEIQSLLQSEKKDFDGLIVLRLDRLFRDCVKQVAWLRFLGETDCAIYSITEIVDHKTVLDQLFETLKSQ
ncbi:MAG: recombinase family protein [Dehalococcoidia bacterium]|jgi:site-specific DNA recombinase